jgi:hypothetical protein
MFKGFILSESLKDPTILNNLEKEYVSVENHIEYGGGPKVWHNFKVIVSNEDIIKITEELAKNMKETWYAHFWSDLIVYVVLPNKVFKVPREKEWKSKEYQICKDYASKHGVEEQYLEFLLDT